MNAHSTIKGVPPIPLAHLHALVPMRGYGPVYHPGDVNHCPGCGRSHWHVGRISAECAFCSTALPLVEAGVTTPSTLRRAA